METKLTRADIEAALKVYQVLSPLMEAAVTELCGRSAYLTGFEVIPGMVVLNYKEFGGDDHEELRIPFEDLCQALDDPAALRAMVHRADAREGTYSRKLVNLTRKQQSITQYMDFLGRSRNKLLQDIGAAVVGGLPVDSLQERLMVVNLELEEYASKLEGINHAIKEVQNGR